MNVAERIVTLVVVQLLLLAAARTAGAADAKEAMEKLRALSQSASASYTDGDFDKTRSQLQEAIALAKDSGLSSNRIIAQVYILFGVVKINEHKDTEAGVRYFAKALDISPAAKIPPTMATKAVKAAFAKAEDVDPATIGILARPTCRPLRRSRPRRRLPRPRLPPPSRRNRRKRRRLPPRRPKRNRPPRNQAGRGRAQAGGGGAQAGRHRQRDAGQ